MVPPRTRRIWHAEATPLADALDAMGAWQAALRVRVAHAEALRRRPEGSAFDLRPTPEDAAPLAEALRVLRGAGAGATTAARSGARRDS